MDVVLQAFIYLYTDVCLFIYLAVTKFCNLNFTRFEWSVWVLNLEYLCKYDDNNMNW